MWGRPHSTLFQALEGSQPPQQASLEGLGTAEMQGGSACGLLGPELNALALGAGQTWGQGTPSIRDVSVARIAWVLPQDLGLLRQPLSLWKWLKSL